MESCATEGCAGAGGPPGGRGGPRARKEGRRGGAAAEEEEEAKRLHAAHGGAAVPLVVPPAARRDDGEEGPPAELLGSEDSQGDCGFEACLELRAILAQRCDSSSTLRSSIFGCSPPVRTGDPVVRDQGFGTVHGLLAAGGEPPVRAPRRSLGTCAVPAAQRVEGFFVKGEHEQLVH